jgi:hypothetical protein
VYSLDNSTGACVYTLRIRPKLYILRYKSTWSRTSSNTSCLPIIMTVPYSYYYYRYSLTLTTIRPLLIRGVYWFSCLRPWMYRCPRSTNLSSSIYFTVCVYSPSTRNVRISFKPLSKHVSLTRAPAYLPNTRMLYSSYFLLNLIYQMYQCSLYFKDGCWIQCSSYFQTSDVHFRSSVEVDCLIWIQFPVFQA